MTVALSGSQVAQQLAEHFPGAIAEASPTGIIVRTEALFDVAHYLKTSLEFDFDYLNYITAVDYYDYLEVVYQLTSRRYNHTLVMKTRCYDRENPTVFSVVRLWQGADFQEREIYDLMGICFLGHPNLKRIFLWEGFKGHPLRKDYL